jgi:hypothetical protein
LRGLGDRIDAGDRDDPERGLGARQCNLDVQHVLHASAIVEDGSHRCARYQRRQK